MAYTENIDEKIDRLKRRYEYIVTKGKYDDPEAEERRGRRVGELQSNIDKLVHQRDGKKPMIKPSKPAPIDPNGDGMGGDLLRHNRHSEKPITPLSIKDVNDNEQQAGTDAGASSVAKAPMYGFEFSEPVVVMILVGLGLALYLNSR